MTTARFVMDLAEMVLIGLPLFSWFRERAEREEAQHEDGDVQVSKEAA